MQPHRISVRSVTQNRRTSRDAACTMIIGRDTAHLGPSAVKATSITCSSSIISWLPANSNHQHVVCVNNVEVRTVKPGVYRHTITGTCFAVSKILVYVHFVVYILYRIGSQHTISCYCSRKTLTSCRSSTASWSTTGRSSRSLY